MILAYGRLEYDHQGSRRCFLGKSEKRRIASEYPELIRRYGRKLDLVVVTPASGEKTVITAYVRHRSR